MKKSVRKKRADAYERIFDKFTAPIAPVDCGKMCAPLNNGQPVCCTTEHAVPIVDKGEWDVLNGRTDLWFKFKPFDAVSREIVDDLHEDCIAIECKGAAFCERHNRSLACRAFPFFPYFSKAKDFVGFSHYWAFEDRCWVISNMQIAEQAYIDQMVWAYEHLFVTDEEQREVYEEYSASMRRVFSRWKRVIPIVGRNGGFMKDLPKGGGIVPAKPAEFGKWGPYTSRKDYEEAVAAEGGTLPDEYKEIMRM